MSARRPAVIAATGAALAVAVLASTSRAQDRAEPLGGKRHRPAESPQHFAAEVRFSPFTPDIDSDPSLTGRPFATAFGTCTGTPPTCDTSPRVLVSVELDWQALRIPHVGSLGPGLGAGYTTMSAQAQFTTLHNGSSTSGETTSLDIYPFYAVAVLRADGLWRDFGVPLVPYAKLGFGYALWRASNTLGTSSAGGVAGKGHTVGTELALGLGLNLNVFDQYAAKNFDDSMGVNNTYLFAEWTRAALTGLGSQTNALRVGGTSWTFGLAFEF